MKNQIAHIINVTEINETKKASYLHIAQPVTMRSMLTAKKTAGNAVNVDLYAVKHKDELVNIPNGFNWVKDIEKYAWEYIQPLRDILPHKPLPRLVDIITGLFNVSEAEYFVYSNVDIGVFPSFYLFINDRINQGLDAFCINRRTLPKEYSGIVIDETNFELCYSMYGELHPGADCFIFRRDIIPLLNFNHVFVGFPPVGGVLRSQIELNSKKFQMLLYAHETFHLGNDRVWKDETNPYWIENVHQAKGLSIKHRYKHPINSKIDKYKYLLFDYLRKKWKF